MAPYSDDAFESDVDEDIVAAEPSEAEMPRVSPATKVKPTPRVYQPVYPASPMTIAGGVSPNVSPSPGKSPGTNVFRGDEPARTRSGGSGETEEEAKEQATAVAGVSASRRTPKEEAGSPVTKKASIDATSSPSPTASSPIASSKEKPPRARWIRPETHTKKNASVDANKRPRETAWAATRRTRVPNRSTNPVEMRREFLARRRREAAANAPRTPGEARAATRVTQTDPRTDANVKKNAYENKNNQTRRYAGVARDAFGVHQRTFVPRVPARVVRADLRSGAPIFSRRAADALEASGARNVLAEDPSSAGEDPSGGTPARTACFVAVAEPGRGGVFSAARGPASPYAPLPTHRTYAWYKQFGFAGKGASSSWGFNPKRADLFAAYAKANATRENPRRRHF